MRSSSFLTRERRSHAFPSDPSLRADQFPTLPPCVVCNSLFFKQLWIVSRHMDRHNANILRADGVYKEMYRRCGETDGYRQPTTADRFTRRFMDIDCTRCLQPRCRWFITAIHWSDECHSTSVWTEGLQVGLLYVQLSRIVASSRDAHSCMSTRAQLSLHYVTARSFIERSGHSPFTLSTTGSQDVLETVWSKKFCFAIPQQVYSL